MRTPFHLSAATARLHHPEEPVVKHAQTVKLMVRDTPRCRGSWSSNRFSESCQLIQPSSLKLSSSIAKRSSKRSVPASGMQKSRGSGTVWSALTSEGEFSGETKAVLILTCKRYSEQRTSVLPRTTISRTEPPRLSRCSTNSCSEILFSHLSMSAGRLRRTASGGRGERRSASHKGGSVNFWRSRRLQIRQHRRHTQSSNTVRSVRVAHRALQAIPCQEGAVVLDNGMMAVIIGSKAIISFKKRLRRGS